jgi:TonB-linked SusC/RagA family outer membrane protein
MKFTVFFLLVTCLKVSANGYSPKISISESNVSLNRVFNEIENQSEYQFFYKDKLLKQIGNVSVSVRDVSIEEALDKCFFDLPLTYTLIDNNVIISEKKLPQKLAASYLITTAVPITVKGLVKDEKGLPLSGVSVTVRGTQRGTTTNGNGEFTIDANTGEVLDFSIVGYKKTSIAVGNNTSVNIQLQIDVVSGSEVIVVGYGTQKKANLTGAVDQVSGDILDNRPITRLSQGLQGVVGNLNILTSGAGGMPNATQSINIRGYTGLGSRGTPLFVIDGIPGGDINSINPNDVESISVLKDQASAAIYGVDGAFGVILINTKQGKKGKAPQINYDNNFSYSQLINVPKETNSLEYVTMFNEASVNGGQSPIFLDEQIQRIKDYIAGTLKTETMPDPANPTRWITGQLGNANNKWFDVLFNKWAVSQQHNIGVTGGGTNTNYYVGLGYIDRNGMFSYGNDDYKRYNLRANLGIDINKWLKTNFRTSFARGTNDRPFEFSGRTGGTLGAYLHQAGRTAPFVANVNPNGSLSQFSDAAWMGSGSRILENADEVKLTGEFVLNPLKGLNITGNYTINSNNSDLAAQGKTMYVPQPNGELVAFGQIPNTFSRTFAKSTDQLINIFSSYEKGIGDHNFQVLGGYIRRFNQSLSLTSTNANLYTDNLPALFLTYNDKPTVSDAIGEFATEGYFSRINYSFKNRYLIEFDGRYDATSRFISDRWQFYPGLSAGYVVSQEKFWQSLSNTINFLKFRASYGKSGDQASLSLYPFYPSLNTVIPASTNWLFASGRQAYVSAPGVINPNITWQKPIMLDFGLDAAFLKNRLNVNFDWYRRTMKDLIVSGAPLPAVFGTSAPSINDGETETTGFEFTTSWSDKIGALKYSVRALLSNYTGKVTKYDPNPTKLLSATYYTGSNIGEIWGYRSPGLYTSQTATSALPASFWTSGWSAGDVQYLDLDKSGRIDIGKNTADSSGDLSVIGNTTPRYSYSFNLDLNWKGFDLNLFVQGVAKRDVWIDNNYFWGITGSRFQSGYFETQRDNRWSADNPNGYFPKYYMTSQMSKNMQVSDRYLQNAAYLRIKTMQLGYSLPTELIGHWHVKKARVYVTAENLATITKMVKTLDPEIAVADAGAGLGKVYPLQRTFSFGINIGL